MMLIRLRNEARLLTAIQKTQSDVFTHFGSFTADHDCWGVGPHVAKGILKADLDRYAALHAQTYGEAVDAEKLIPQMLDAFKSGDRGFRKRANG